MIDSEILIMHIFAIQKVMNFKKIQIYQKEAYPLKEGEIAEPLRNPTLTVT